MESLDLDIEDRVGVDDEAGLVLHVSGQTQLVLALGFPDALQERAVLFEGHEFLELRGIVEPAVTDGLGNQFGVAGIGLGEEAAM